MKLFQDKTNVILTQNRPGLMQKLGNSVKTFTVTSRVGQRTRPRRRRSHRRTRRRRRTRRTSTLTAGTTMKTTTKFFSLDTNPVTKPTISISFLGDNFVTATATALVSNDNVTASTNPQVVPSGSPATSPEDDYYDEVEFYDEEYYYEDEVQPSQ